MASATGLAHDQPVGDASNVANSTTATTHDGSAQQDSSSGAPRGANYVGIDILGKALQIAVDTDPDAAKGGRVSNGMPKAVNLDTLMKTISKLQEGAGWAPATGEGAAGGAQRTASAEQGEAGSPVKDGANKEDQETRMGGQSSSTSQQPQIPAPPVGPVQAMALPSLAAALLAQSPRSPQDVCTTPTVGKVFVGSSGEVAIVAEGLGPTSSGVNNSVSPHSSGILVGRDSCTSPPNQDVQNHVPQFQPAPASSSTSTKPLGRFSSRRGPSSKTSPYRGVSCYKRTGRWEAHIWHAGRQVHLGTYSTSQEAARVYDTAAIKLRGWSADLNFNVEDYKDDPTLKDAPIQLDKNSEEQSVADMVKGLKRRSKGYGGRGGKRGKQCLKALEPSRNGVNDVATHMTRQGCWPHHMTPVGMLNVNHLHADDPNLRLRVSRQQDPTQRLGQLALEGNDHGRRPSAPGDAMGGFATGVAGPAGGTAPAHFIVRGGVDTSQHVMSRDPMGRVIVHGPGGGLFVASSQSKPGIVPARVVGDGSGRAYWGHMTRGCVGQPACGLQGSGALQMAPSKVVSFGNSAAIGRPALPEGVLTAPQTGAVWRTPAAPATVAPRAAMDEDQLAGRPPRPCEVVLEGKPVRSHAAAAAQTGITAYWPGLEVQQASTAGPKLEQMLGLPRFHAPVLARAQGHSSVFVPAAECFQRPRDQDAQKPHALPCVQHGVLCAANNQQGVAPRSTACQPASAEQQGHAGSGRSMHRIARLMEVINDLPANNLVKSNVGAAGPKQESQGQSDKEPSAEGTMHVGPQTVRSCAKLQVVPSVLSRRLSDQEGCGAEPQSARSEGRVSGNGSTDPGIALQSMVSSLAKFVDNNNLGQKSSSAASDLARTPNPNSCTIEADTSGQEAAPLQSASTSQDRTKKEAFAQLESSRHNSETDCQEGSQQGDVEETAEDLLAAEQLCALATVGREATAAAESSPKPSEDRQIAAAGGDQPLPTWQVKRPRTNSFRGRQDFDSLESALRESGMSVVNGQQDFLNAFLNAQNSTRRAAVSLGAPGNGFKNCTTPTKRRRLDVGALLDSTMDQPMAESQPVEGDSCNDGLKLESESMGLAEDDGHCGRRGSNDSSATAVPDAEMSVDGAGSPTCHGLEAMKDATEAKGVAVDAQDYSTQMSSLRLGVLST